MPSHAQGAGGGTAGGGGGGEGGGGRPRGSHFLPRSGARAVAQARLAHQGTVTSNTLYRHLQHPLPSPLTSLTVDTTLSMLESLEHDWLTK
eukprot:5945076-Pyramimonas_sp.AAC.2